MKVTWLMAMLLGVYLLLHVQVVHASSPCCSFPCQHDGVCMTKGMDKYICDCTRTGYYGNNCQTPEWGTWFTQLVKPSSDTTHYILTHFSWFWSIVNNIEFLRNFVIGKVYVGRSDRINQPPEYESDHEYVTLEAFFNESYYARTLPPVPRDCPTPMGIAGKKELPDIDTLSNKFFKRTQFIPDHMNTSTLFAFFAQFFTHQFFKTDLYGMGAAFTWGHHGVDKSNIYGNDVGRQNSLRTFKNGKMKMQVINGEEWPPYQKDTNNISMVYPPHVPDEQRFALGHPFFALLPGLFAYTTIWLREHNRVCDILKTEHPEWDDEQLYQTARLIIVGETIKIVIEDYVQHLASYNFRLVYNPEVLFGVPFQYDNRIHLEFNLLYHWHPFMPDVFEISGVTYTLDDFMYNVKPVLEHGMSSFVDAMSKTLAGKMSHHNHAHRTLPVLKAAIKHGRELRLQSFNNYRKRFKLKPYTSFEDLTGEKAMAAKLKEVYGDIDAVEFVPGLYLEKTRYHSTFGATVVEIGAPFSVKGLLSNPVSSPHYWKPSTFGGGVGFDIVKMATLEKLFCLNIKGDCPLVTFRVPEDIARKARAEEPWNIAAQQHHDEL